MEDHDRNMIEAMLPEYFSGRLAEEDKKLVDEWKRASEENAVLFDEYGRLWRSMGLLKEMESIDTVRALNDVNNRINHGGASRRLITVLGRIAAVLFIPLLCYTLVSGIKGRTNGEGRTADVSWQTISTSAGMRGSIDLPDGSRVTLNSGSEIRYPTRFTKGNREVQLTGEAFFEVTKDKKKPFIVRTGKLNVEVLGTTFNVSAYNDGKPAEVVLASGSVRLFQGEGRDRRQLALLKPDQRAVYNAADNKLSVSGVDTDKYLAWREGNIIFRDDPMSDVISRLERWFNVDIYVEDKSILDYEITARFHDETLEQVLTLLKLSSGIEYSVEKNSQLKDGDFTRTKIYLKKRQK